MASWKDSFLKEIEEISSKNKIKEHEAFIFWFLSASENLKYYEVRERIIDRNDGSRCDAVYIDDKLRSVKIVHADYSSKIGEAQYPKEEILALCGLYDYVVGKKEYAEVAQYLPKQLKDKVELAHRRIAENNYSVRVQYITTRKDNPNGHEFDNGEYNIEIRSAKEIERMYEEWRHGHVPDMGDVSLSFEHILEASAEQNPAPKSYIIHVNTNELRDIYGKWKEKLFSRNVRIFYGGTKKANKEMERTLAGEPEHFWYYNNGVTILSEKVTVKSRDKKIILKNPQVINGCQTISTIGETNKKKDGSAYILAKIIEIPDDSENQVFIDGIIQANNRQTPVDERILKSNHPLQVALQRQLTEEPWNYYLERKEGQYKLEKARSQMLNGLTCLKNIELVKAAITVKRAPHIAHESEDELFSTHFSSVFVDDKPTVDYLLPYLLWQNIIKIGKNHNQGGRGQFNKLASYHILKMVYDTCPNLRDNTKKKKICEYLQEYEGLDDGTIAKLFEINHNLFNKSEYKEQNGGQRDFFKNRETYVKMENATPASLRREMEKMFRGS
jgi:hypothetical protein